ncbi:MAG: single-stranded-DNA-specific exonuclease RecJ [Burkholderiales bacterium]|nr:single-stranded-DNA-specific exonuclease RecJ [Burkholderiales bacterium]
MTILVRRSTHPVAPALEAAGLSPVLARVYAARGIASAAELDHSLAALPSFAGLRGIGEAADRLARAIARRERILIVADYDADGATACAVGVRGLRALGADVDFIVPNRFEFGYGLTPEIVALAAQRAPALLVTVDNGIASVDGVAAASARGIDVLITDHHVPGPALPAPAIIVNPNQPGCEFVSKHLAGVGVMFYVLTATRARLRDDGAFAARAPPNLAALLDLVALGTVADVVRLDQTNRVLVEQGLARMRAGKAHAGVQALFAVAARDVHRATAYDLGFVAGPRLNAAGRLADMTIGIRCLLADSAGEATELARTLDTLNRERREIEATMQDEALADLALATVDVPEEQSTLCLYRPEWHQGVVGIVAARLKDRFHRPTVVFARAGNGELRGSGRSIAGFHLRDALDLVAKRRPGSILRFGGHAFAAGLSLPEDQLPSFRDALEEVAQAQLTPADLARTVETDGVLAPGELHLDLARSLRERVWGQGMPPPTFDDTFDVLASRVVGGAHTRLTLGRGGERFEAILFRHADPLPPRVRAAYRPAVNEWQGTFALELAIEHWWPAP